ncbi:MAG: hypothetical protein RLY31_1416 [Bacteroidota bacterium]
MIAKSLCIIGQVCYYAGRYDEAAAYNQEALDVPRVGPVLRSALLNNLGLIYEYQGKLGEAAEHYHLSMEEAAREGDTLSYFQSHINLGFIYIDLGEHPVAERYLTDALAYFERQSDIFHAGLCLQNLGVLYAEQEANEGSIRYFEAAADHFERAESPENHFEALVDLFHMLTRAAHFDRAEELLPRLSIMAEHFSNPYTLSVGKMVKGKYAYLAAGDYCSAEQLLREAEAGFIDLHATTKLVVVYEDLINLYGMMEDYQQQQAVMQEYQRILKEKYRSEAVGRVAAARTDNTSDGTVGDEDGNLSGNRLVRSWWLALLAGGMAWGYLYFRWHARRVANRESHRFELSTDAANPMANDAATEVLLDQSVVPDEWRDEFFVNLFSKIETHINDKARYLDPDLKISDIAFELGTNNNYISRAFTKVGQTKFNDYISVLRSGKRGQTFAE